MVWIACAMILHELFIHDLTPPLFCPPKRTLRRACARRTPSAATSRAPRRTGSATTAARPCSSAATPTTAREYDPLGNGDRAVGDNKLETWV